MKLDEAIVDNFDDAALAELAAGLDISPAEPDAAALAVALIETLAAAGRAGDLLDALAAARPYVPWAELPYPAATLRRLHATLCRRHSLDSLRTLAFRLGLDFDELPGDTKSARARELVLAMDRQGRAAELVARYPRRAARNNPPRPVPDRAAILRRAVSWLYARWLSCSPARPLALSAGLLLALGLLAADHRPQFDQGPPAERATERRPLPELAGRPAPLPSAAPVSGESFSPGASPTPASRPVAAAQADPGATLTADNIPRLLPTLAPAVLVGERGANLRRGPGPEYEVVATLRAGARLALRAISPTGEWYQVRLAGKGTPWVDARYAMIIGGVGGAPVATGESAAGTPAAAAHSPANATPAPTLTRPAATPAVYSPRPTARPSATPPAPPSLVPTMPPP